LKNDNYLICLTGLPASGKSTFANKFKAALEKSYDKIRVKIIDPDIIRQKLSPDKFEPDKEQNVRKKNLEIIRRELKRGFLVISDDLNYYSSMRHDLKEIAESFRINFIIIHIATPIEICLKWNEARGSPIPNEVIKKIQDKFDNFDKYSWDYPEVIIDPSANNDNKSKVGEIIKNHRERLKKIKLMKKKETNNILVHSNLYVENLEKISRNYVSKLLQSPIHFPFKNKILRLRRVFVKNIRNTVLKKADIKKSFKKFLEKELKITISESSA